MSLPTLRRAAPAPASFRTCSAYVRNYSDGISLPSEASSEQSRKPHKSRTKKPEKQIFFSGIQPTGVPHLGNYLGALRQWVKLEKEASRHDQVLFSIADLHAITIKQDPAELAKWRKEMLASLLAVGLNPKKSLIFEQSSVKAHTDLMWILSCSASMGYLGRMTQWKVHLTTRTQHYMPLSHTDTRTEQAVSSLRRLPHGFVSLQQRLSQTRPLLLPRPPSRRHPSLPLHPCPRR